jgi:lipoprotein-anchoring transpeptidase ErfK/SrfK
MFAFVDGCLPRGRKPGEFTANNAVLIAFGTSICHNWPVRIASRRKLRASAIWRATVLVGAVALAAGCNAAHVAVPHVKVPAPRHVVAAASAYPMGSTTVATLHGAVPGSATPGAPEDTVVPVTWYGYPSVLPVINSTANWVEVRLAQRPNGLTTWVPSSDVTLSLTPYLLVLNLATEHLVVYENGQQVMDFPAGVGSADDPTVTGDYFVTMRAPAPDPGYGPFVLVTSAHSDSIADWAGSGDAIIAIHGPITAYDDQLIGNTGAAISHGCIRLHDADLAQLAGIPAGTPLDIVPGVA